MKVMHILASVIGLAISMTLIYWLAFWLLSVPLVIISSTTQECVKVESDNRKYSCENLPEFYFTSYTR